MSNRILIVDDEAHVVKMVAKRLEANGYGVITASNGVEGYEQAVKEKPDLILLDVQMPVMDGYKALKKLKENNSTTQIPVMMFTAKGQVDEVEKAFTDGVVDYIVKPFDPVVLIEKIRNALSNT